VQEWSRFDQEIISAAVKEWRARLRACAKADGGHFERFLWQLMKDHTASSEIPERVVRVVTETCVVDVQLKTCNVM